MKQKQIQRWDLFCSVVDNFGDIGICWRMARQLVLEHQQVVRLWIDDLNSFQRICPEILLGRSQQFCRGVDVRYWPKSWPKCFPLLSNNNEQEPAIDVVVQVLACSLPELYLQEIAQQKNAPVWLNMEYLSAEEWVLGCHLLPSPHGQLSLRKIFYFPGFVAGTAGLLREKNLLQDRDSFQADEKKQTDFWSSLGLPPKPENELRISLFAYGALDSLQTNELDQLIHLWANGDRPIVCLIAQGQLAEQFFADKASLYQQGNVTVRQIPFIEQDQYDRLLWACDVNFVRGEDSFVRAQWAGKPFVWQIYRQDDNAHAVKLEAFMQLFTEDLSASAASALKDFWQAWNYEEAIAETWPAFFAELGNLAEHQQKWVRKMQKLGDFTTNMMLYCQK